ncbi:hypothetical protein C4J81_14790 [Deltaproteobacteria bacterium Smac51]|nr:hypothetical protein C4J81_14790 [Deltaproteobacteria bacterium Smac51]
MSKLKEVERLLGPDKPTFLITTGEDGRPDARAMAVIETEGLKTLWMMTGKQCDKFKQLSREPKCLIYATDFEDDQEYQELRLWGRMELLDDAASKERVWRDYYKCYFPGGKDDPNLCVLKFTADSGMLQTKAGKEKLSF